MASLLKVTPQTLLPDFIKVTELVLLIAEIFSK
jgi:hypothetical protein